mgnify:CR=1 FL=1
MNACVELPAGTYRLGEPGEERAVTLERVLSTAEQLNTVEPALWHRGECDEIILKGMLDKHFRFTGSQRARAILDDWEHSRARFVKVFPMEYRRALGEIDTPAHDAWRQAAAAA